MERIRLIKFSMKYFRACSLLAYFIGNIGIIISEISNRMAVFHLFSGILNRNDKHRVDPI